MDVCLDRKNSLLFVHLDDLFVGAVKSSGYRPSSRYELANLTFFACIISKFVIIKFSCIKVFFKDILACKVIKFTKSHLLARFDD